MILISFLGIPVVHAQEPDFAWAKRFGSNSKIVYGGAVAIDHQGNSYISSVFAGTSFTLDGITLQSSSSARNGYIAKYNPQGEILWAKLTVGILTVAGTLPTPNTDKTIIDELGNIYLSGEYDSGLDSSINNYTLSSFSADNQAKRDYFLAKLDPEGNILWVKTTTRSYYYTSSGNNDIHFDLQGNINMTGYFRESITFTPENTLTHTINEGAVFLTKYNPQGQILLCKKLEGSVLTPFDTSTSNSEQVKPDAQGNLYRWSNNYSGKKLYRYNAQGDLLDTKTVDITSSIPEYSPSLSAFAVDPQGNVFLGGEFFGNLTIGGINYTHFGNNTNCDAILFKLNASTFNIDWAYHPEYIANDSFRKLLTDGLGNVYAAGQNDDASENRMLLKKFSNNGTQLWEKVVHGLYAEGVPLGGIHPSAICQANNGGNVWVSGTFRVNAYFDETAQFMTPSLSHFNGFLVQYGTCNIAQPEINVPAVTQLCEGETMELTGSFTNSDLDYKWNTGATTETITINHAGIYYVVAQQGEECYGKSKEIWITEIPLPESTITMENGILTAIASEGTYQWINCTTQNPIVGATAQSFTPSIAGTYAVEITNEAGCSNTSDCLTITEEELGTDTHYLADNSIILYPNPASDKITLQAVNQIEKITIVNMLGQVVLEHKNDVSIDITKLAKGQYILIAKTQTGTWRGKFIKK